MKFWKRGIVVACMLGLVGGLTPVNSADAAIRFRPDKKKEKKTSWFFFGWFRSGKQYKATNNTIKATRTALMRTESGAHKIAASMKRLKPKKRAHAKRLLAMHRRRAMQLRNRLRKLDAKRQKLVRKFKKYLKKAPQVLAEHRRYEQKRRKMKLPCGPSCNRYRQNIKKIANYYRANINFHKAVKATTKVEVKAVKK